MMIIRVKAIRGHKTLLFQLQHDQRIDFDIHTNLETLKPPSLTIRRMRYSTDAPFDGCRKLIRRMPFSTDAIGTILVLDSYNGRALTLSE